MFGRQRYNVSKLLEVLIVRKMAAMRPNRTVSLDAKGDYPVTVNMVHPGMCHSDLAREEPVLSPVHMMKYFLARTAELHLPAGSTLEGEDIRVAFEDKFLTSPDIRITTTDQDSGLERLRGSSLTFLGFVSPDLIPLHLIQSSGLLVGTDNESTKSWLDRSLIDEEPIRFEPQTKCEDAQPFAPWHSSQALQSSIAVLARPSQSQEPVEDLPRITELLLYAERSTPGANRLPTPPLSSDHDDDGFPFPDITSNIQFRCLLLSSDLLYKPLAGAKDPTQAGEAHFVFPESSPKRRLNSLFDEAADRRKKARHNGVRSLSIAASLASSTPRSPRVSSLNEAKTSERPSSSCSSARGPHPAAAINQLDPKKRSTSTSANQSEESLHSANHMSAEILAPAHLPKETAATNSFNDASIEMKNKQSISRVVMAGMRLYGLQQRKTKLVKHIDTQAAEDTFNHGDTGRDIEFKSVYHHAYKATLFAFVDYYAQTNLAVAKTFTMGGSELMHCCWTRCTVTEESELLDLLQDFEELSVEKLCHAINPDSEQAKQIVQQAESYFNSTAIERGKGTWTSLLRDVIKRADTEIQQTIQRAENPDRDGLPLCPRCNIAAVERHLRSTAAFAVLSLRLLGHEQDLASKNGVTQQPEAGSQIAYARAPATEASRNPQKQQKTLEAQYMSRHGLCKYPFAPLAVVDMLRAEHGD
ncbi:MAG: hypothetical protein Q9159_006717 [Coniocarpon cinnabarinum]